MLVLCLGFNEWCVVFILCLQEALGKFTQVLTEIQNYHNVCEILYFVLMHCEWNALCDNLHSFSVTLLKKSTGILY